MSRLGAAGWSAIGRSYGKWYFWVWMLGVVVVVVWLIWLVLWALGLAKPVQTVLEYVFWILGFIFVVLFFGLAAVIGWTFVKDLGHNFYSKWKATGIGTAFKGLLSDLSTCGKALVSGIGKTAKEYGGPIIGKLKKFFGL
jgi:hypothetical protein